MNIDSAIFSTGTAFIAILISIVAYFAKKWFEYIYETLKEHGKNLEDHTKQIISLKQEQGFQAAHISKTIHEQNANLTTRLTDINSKIEKIDMDETATRDKLLQRIDLLQDNFGKIILLEGSMRDQNEKLTTLYKVVKHLIDKKQPDQK